MFLNKRIQDRHNIVIAGHNRSVSLFIFTFNVSIIIDHQFCGKSISIHVMIIADIIFRKYERNLALRKHDLASAHGSVIIHYRHVVRAYQNISLIIHNLDHFFELTDCRHHLIISCLIRIPVKSQRGVYDKGMEKHMCHLLKRILYTGISFFHIGSSCLLHFITGGKFPVVLQNRNRSCIIILLSQFLCLCEKCLFIGGSTAGSVL